MNTVRPLIVLTTTSNAAEAKKIAEALVTDRLAACVQIVPEVLSVYRWKDAVEQASEVVLIIKTTSSRFESVKSAILELHSYETPEVVGIEIAEAAKEYLDWLLLSVV
ncbi:MAG: divalent-cation tolerance protein CutA [Pyrinomonadaceae bacterium]